MSNKCCIEFALLNAPTGVNFLGSPKAGLWKGMCPDGFVSGICLPPAGEVFKCFGNCLLLFMGFQTSLNCNGSTFEEEWGLSNCLLRMERNRINIFAW